MAFHHVVEEVAQRGEVLVARGDAGGFREFRKILPYVPGRDLRQLAPAVFLGPLEKTPHRVQIGAAGMLVADGAEEEFLGGEDGIGAARATIAGISSEMTEGRFPGGEGGAGGFSDITAPAAGGDGC
jgi:hypothetical protein